MSDLIGGLAIGGIYALVAIGVVLIYRTTGLVNFAQGELLTVGGYAYVFASSATTAPAATIVLSILGGIVAGAVLFFIIHFLLRGREQLNLVVATLAMLTLVQGGARLLATDRPYRAETWLFGDRTVSFSGATLPVNSLVILGVTAVAAIGLFVWFTRTTVGKAMAAVAEDPLRSAMAGIPVRTILLLSWCGAGALAALAGVLISPVTGVYPAMGAQLLLPAIVGAVIGGLDSVLGALVGGLAVGLVQTYATVMLGGDLRDVVVFSLLLLILLVRPSGLFGSRELRRA